MINLVKCIFSKLKNRKINISSSVGVLLIVLLLIPILTFVFFIIHFRNETISNKPNDWYEFISIIVGIINLVITGVIAWLVNTINKKNSRRNSVLQFIGEIYIDLENVTEITIKVIDDALLLYDFSNVNVQQKIDTLENKLVKLRPKYIAFYDDDTCNNFNDLVAIVKDFNFQIRFLKSIKTNISDEDIFRDTKILEYYVSMKKSLNNTKRLMNNYLKE